MQADVLSSCGAEGVRLEAQPAASSGAGGLRPSLGIPAAAHGHGESDIAPCQKHADTST